MNARGECGPKPLNARTVLTLLLAVVLLAGYSFLPAQTPSPLGDDSVAAFRVRFGLTDSQPRAWDGELSVDRGQVLSLRNWNPHPEERINGNTGWRLATREGLNYPPPGLSVGRPSRHRGVCDDPRDRRGAAKDVQHARTVQDRER